MCVQFPRTFVIDLISLVLLQDVGIACFQFSGIALVGILFNMALRTLMYLCVSVVEVVA